MTECFVVFYPPCVPDGWAYMRQLDNVSRHDIFSGSHGKCWGELVRLLYSVGPSRAFVFLLSQAVQSWALRSWVGLGSASQIFQVWWPPAVSASEQLTAKLSWIRPQSSLFLNLTGDSDELSKLPSWLLSWSLREGSPTHMLFLRSEAGLTASVTAISNLSASSPITLTCLYIFQWGWRVKKDIQLVSRPLWSFCIMFGVYSFPCCSEPLIHLRIQNLQLHQNHQPGILFLLPSLPNGHPLSISPDLRPSIPSPCLRLLTTIIKPPGVSTFLLSAYHSFQSDLCVVIWLVFAYSSYCSRHVVVLSRIFLEWMDVCLYRLLKSFLRLQETLVVAAE